MSVMDFTNGREGHFFSPKLLRKDQLGCYVLITAALWTGVLGAILLWNTLAHNQYIHNIVLFQARAFFEQILTTRYWNASHGGVYVPITAKTQPNPYLHDRDRDILTVDGRRLTKINPAYMTRQIAEIAAHRNNVKFHITSLKPIRPGNAADEWERRALRSFSSRGQEVLEEFPTKDGDVGFRYMAPLWVEESCLTCHREQGYKLGDLRGGISILIPGREEYNLHRHHLVQMFLAYISIWLLGLTVLAGGYYQLRKSADQREKLIVDLQKALAEVKTLSGLLPICASCKKIRDDQGYWNQIEVYFQKHSQAQFSHGICPDCLERLYPEYSNNGRKNQEGE